MLKDLNSSKIVTIYEKDYFFAFNFTKWTLLKGRREI